MYLHNQMIKLTKKVSKSNFCFSIMLCNTCFYTTSYHIWKIWYLYIGLNIPCRLFSEHNIYLYQLQERVTRQMLINKIFQFGRKLAHRSKISISKKKPHQFFWKNVWIFWGIGEEIFSFRNTLVIYYQKGVGERVRLLAPECCFCSTSYWDYL